MEHLHEGLQATFDLWMKNETISSTVKINSVSLLDIMEKQKCTIIDSMITMSAFF